MARVAKLSVSLSDQRRDFLHQLSARIVATVIFLVLLSSVPVTRTRFAARLPALREARASEG